MVKSKPVSGSQWENCEGIIIDNGNGTMSWTGMDTQIIGAGVSGSKIYKVAVTKVQ